MIKKILVFWNPGAGKITAEKVDHAIQRLRSNGFDVSLQPTQPRSRKEGICQDYVKCLHGQEAVLIAGGDGTISNVVNGLGNHLTIPFGIIPFGTVNLLSREIGVTQQNFDHPFKQLKTKRIYLATLNDIRFIMTASVGFDAKSVAALDVSLKRKIGALAYVAALLKTLKSCRTDCYDVTCDGQNHQAKSVIIMNGKYYAGSYCLGYKTGIDQPNFQVYLFGKNDFFSVLRFCLNMAFQRLHKCADIKVLQTSSVVVKSQEVNSPVQADGDVALRLPIQIRTHDHPYQLLIP
ncbi:diacylglycerol/lipid kinase family protein [Terasakiella pusilla]|uniref:diacylglycerol/lipid kinase family protein n=1 Tax=Terasakiella pusilla TaxID=64973 RepID=UPI003AA9401D